MPKVHVSERQQDLDRLMNNLKLIEGGRTTAEMGKAIGISSSTYSRKRKKPETFSYKEIYRLCRFANVDISDFVGGRLRLKGE